MEPDSERRRGRGRRYADPMPLPLLMVFAGRHGDSRLAELEAVAQRVGAPPLAWAWDRRVLAMNGGDVGPSVLQLLPPLAEADLGWLAAAAAGSVGVRGVFEVWGAGDDVEHCAAQAVTVPPDHVLGRVRGSWKVESLVIGARRSQHPGDLGARMAHFGALLDVLHERPVDLGAPDHRICLLEDRRSLSGGGALPGPPPRYRLLVQLDTAAPAVERRASQLDLRRRAFISTSSLPADRALLLCNLALAGAPTAGATVLDPYCGSGSVLLAAAALGAETVGADIDRRLVSDRLRPVQIPATRDRPGRGVEQVCMRDNFREAGLPEPRALLQLDVARPDAAARLLAANGGRRFDALVTDPPYGRREFERGEAGWDGAWTFRVDAATLGDTRAHLLELGARVLRPGGRLVLLTPVRSPRDESKPTEAALRKALRLEGSARGFRLVHLGVEVVHGGLHRAVVALERG